MVPKVKILNIPHIKGFGSTCLLSLFLISEKAVGELPSKNEAGWYYFSPTTAFIE
jgi:hypothetical protein